MPIPGLNDNHTISGALGVANGNPIAVPGIRASDVILAILRQKAGEASAGVPVATFAAAADEIESASVDTSGYHLTILWSQRN